jgi:hypothetical protein
MLAHDQIDLVLKQPGVIEHVIRVGLGLGNDLTKPERLSAPRSREDLFPSKQLENLLQRDHHAANHRQSGWVILEA